MDDRFVFPRPLRRPNPADGGYVPTVPVSLASAFNAGLALLSQPSRPDWWESGLSPWLVTLLGATPSVWWPHSRSSAVDLGNHWLKLLDRHGCNDRIVRFDVLALDFLPHLKVGDS